MSLGLIVSQLAKKEMFLFIRPFLVTVRGSMARCSVLGQVLSMPTEYWIKDTGIGFYICPQSTGSRIQV